MEITIYHYLSIGLFMFLAGLIGTILVKNVIKVLISIEIMLLGVNINFVTFATFCDGIKFDGYIFTLFYTGIGAVELAIALYLFYLMFQKKKSDNIEKYGDL
ncbi:NADH-quinone oxidoreductase subunit NuoK [bacterium]|nr:NADH-quinone oxidoreductase subunit NuoK [bacterium]